MVPREQDASPSTKESLCALSAEMSAPQERRKQISPRCLGFLFVLLLGVYTGVTLVFMWKERPLVPAVSLILLVWLLYGLSENTGTKRSRARLACQGCPSCGACMGAKVAAEAFPDPDAMWYEPVGHPCRQVQCPDCGEEMKYDPRARSLTVTAEARATRILRGEPLPGVSRRNRNRLQDEDQWCLAFRDFVSIPGRPPEDVRIRLEFIEEHCRDLNSDQKQLLETNGGFAAGPGPPALDAEPVVDLDALRAQTDAALSTPPSQLRECRINAATEWTVKGFSDDTVTIPAGPATLLLGRRQYRSVAFDRIPQFSMTLRSLTTFLRPAIVGLESFLRFARPGVIIPWSEQTRSWRDAFSAATILTPKDRRELMGSDFETDICLELSGVRYSGRGGSSFCSITLAVPEAGGGLWCRIHNLELVNLQERDGIVVVPPFCFPVDVQAFLKGCYSPGTQCRLDPGTTARCSAQLDEKGIPWESTVAPSLWPYLRTDATIILFVPEDRVVECDALFRSFRYPGIPPREGETAEDDCGDELYFPGWGFISWLKEHDVRKVFQSLDDDCWRKSSGVAELLTGEFPKKLVFHLMETGGFCVVCENSSPGERRILTERNAQTEGSEVVRLQGERVRVSKSSMVSAEVALNAALHFLAMEELLPSVDWEILPGIL
jgi:hypothetical protein